MGFDTIEINLVLIYWWLNSVNIKHRRVNLIKAQYLTAVMVLVPSLWNSSCVAKDKIVQASHWSSQSNLFAGKDYSTNACFATVSYKWSLGQYIYTLQLFLVSLWWNGSNQEPILLHQEPLFLLLFLWEDQPIIMRSTPPQSQVCGI